MNTYPLEEFGGNVDFLIVIISTPICSPRSQTLIIPHNNIVKAYFMTPILQMRKWINCASYTERVCYWYLLFGWGS